MVETEPMKRSEKGWYFNYRHECPVCGKNGIAERTKRPLPKPEKWEDRNEISTYACSSHFF